MKITYELQPIHVGQGLTFPDWVSLLTLAFAPLIAHIVAGAPQPSYLSITKGRDRRRNGAPAWHERIPHYNPTSILWRYFAIVDRRLRTRKWTKFDLAASNALFWTAHGWDGTEAMVVRSIPHATYLPRRSTAEIFEEETMKSVIVALQGAQAAYVFVRSFAYFTNLQFLGGDQVFFPLAIIGLFRLFAAAWLSRDFKYTERIYESKSGSGEEGEALGKEWRSVVMVGEADAESRLSLDSLLYSSSSASPDLKPGGGLPSPPVARYEDRYRPVSCWQSRLFRTLYISILLGLWTCTIIWLAPISYNGGGPGRFFTITSLFAAIFYFFFTAVSTAVHGYYFVTEQTTSTVIPCATRLWYKIYTLVLFAAMAVLLIISLVETTKTACGAYTSWPPDMADSTACGTEETYVWHFGPDANSGGYNGIAFTHLPNELNGITGDVAEGKTLKEGEFWVLNATATCLGRWGFDLVTLAKAVDVVNYIDLVHGGNGSVDGDM
ncbi:hypothetical protein F4777DRAFT_552495 [Nemania sp. FL0916]|nr:hypothetical protein F4777DRAFT_552495 [Nemania sp. FL0916]